MTSYKVTMYFFLFSMVQAAPNDGWHLYEPGHEQSLKVALEKAVEDLFNFRLVKSIVNDDYKEVASLISSNPAIKYDDKNLEKIRQLLINIPNFPKIDFKKISDDSNLAYEIQHHMNSFREDNGFSLAMEREYGDFVEEDFTCTIL